MSKTFFLVLWILFFLLGSVGATPQKKSLSASKDYGKSEISTVIDMKYNAFIHHYVKVFRSPAWKDSISSMISRLNLFRDHIAQRIEHYGLPKEILYLPLLESAAHVSVVSYSGAVGLWQFMPNSIGEYGIVVDEWRDERRDFWRSTDAALQKLRYNYDKTGSWLFALAAYNSGLGAVTRAMTKAQNETGEKNFWDLAAHGYLTRQASNYVPKFLAFVVVLSELDQFDQKELIQWSRIPLNFVVDLRILSQKTGIPYELLRQGNAELHFDITPPISERYLLKVPSAFLPVTMEKLQTYEKQFQAFRQYSWHVEDNISDILAYYGVSEETFLLYNPALREKKLQEGNILLFPKTSEIADFRPKREPEFFIKKYKVLSGDTIWGLATKFAIAPDILMKKNRLHAAADLKAGMILEIPLQKEANNA